MREERLRAATALRGTPALALSAWRGRSGRRYVVGIHDLAADAAEIGEAVVLAVRRDREGLAELLDVVATGNSPRTADGHRPGDSVQMGDSPRDRLGGFVARVRSRGATEMHVHRLAESEAERRAVVEDLGGAVSRSVRTTRREN